MTRGEAYAHSAVGCSLSAVIFLIVVPLLAGGIKAVTYLSFSGRFLQVIAFIFDCYLLCLLQVYINEAFHFFKGFFKVLLFSRL
jgi:hypothetical protein